MKSFIIKYSALTED